MIYWELFLGFLKVGLFSFGGGYGAVALIRDVVLSHDWLTEETLSYMIAVSESTPGPIMVNIATYVGSYHGGLLGSFIATAAVVLPSFVIILLLATVLGAMKKNRWGTAVLQGLTACVTGIVLATGIFMVLRSCVGSVFAPAPDLRAILIALALVLIKIFLPRVTKKKLSPIWLIVIAAGLGILIYGV